MTESADRRTGLSISVFLVDDHPLFRAGVRGELAGVFTILGEAGEVEQAVDEICLRRPDVVLLDVHMPDGGGAAVLDRVRERLGSDAPRFLALSVSDAPEDVVDLIRRGAAGYVTKNIAGGDLVEAIESVNSGDAYFSKKLAAFVLHAFNGDEHAGDADSEAALLTPREREVLKLIARGYRYNEIALRLSISPRTVESHVSAVLRKLQLSTRHELSRWASERGLD